MTTSKSIGLGREMLFEFKHIPSYSRTTRPGKRNKSVPARDGLETVGKMGLIIAVILILSMAGLMSVIGAKVPTIIEWLQPSLPLFSIIH